jgi:hypothetical protein
VSADWTIEGTGDFNGDGKSDILWENTTTGQVAIWEMNGLQIQSAAVVATVPGWHVEGTADVNGDGKSDILWQNASTGQTAVWEMNGLAIASVVTLAQVDNSWSPINHHYDWV